MRSIHRAATRAVLVSVIAMIGAGCGGGGDDTRDTGSDTKGSGSEAGVVELDVKPGTLKFVSEDVTAEAGSVTVRSTNPDGIEHNVAIEGNGVSKEGKLVSDGGVSEITVDLEPGEYELYCTPHREAGMIATLTVT